MTELYVLYGEDQYGMSICHFTTEKSVAEKWAEYRFHKFRKVDEWVPPATPPKEEG